MTIIPDKVGRLGGRRAGMALVLSALIPGLAACGAGDGAPIGGRVQVVAAENFWGSVASQLGGDRAEIVSLIASPAIDPHAYEPTPSDGRAMAQAQFVIVNGAGYDQWAQKLIDAGSSSGRRVLTVSEVANRHEGDNPHMWYSPVVLGRVAQRITESYKHLDPDHAAYFDQRAAAFSSVGLARYNDLRATIRTRYGGVPVGATESIFADLASDLGLRLATPPEYMRSVSEGSDPTAGAKATVDAQIAGRQIAVLAYNRQNSTPDVQAVVERARSRGIPVVALTETMDPPTSSYQDWQAAQLDDLRQALSRATGR